MVIHPAPGNPNALEKTREDQSFVDDYFSGGELIPPPKPPMTREELRAANAGYFHAIGEVLGTELGQQGLEHYLDWIENPTGEENFPSSDAATSLLERQASEATTSADKNVRNLDISESTPRKNKPVNLNFREPAPWEEEGHIITVSSAFTERSARELPQIEK